MLLTIVNNITTNTKDQPLPTNNNLFYDSFFDDLHKDFFGNGLLASARSCMSHDFATNIFENQQNIVIQMEVPGIKQDDIEVEITNHNIVKISGTRKQEQKLEHEHIYQQEITYGQFKKSFKLPKKINDDAITAEIKDGILTITLPIIPTDQNSSKKITIN
tara:strand:- start:801 stop:1283 length:483 start_codon:yes stop_codon:yes gene_type:complete